MWLVVLAVCVVKVWVMEVEPPSVRCDCGTMRAHDEEWALMCLQCVSAALLGCTDTDSVGGKPEPVSKWSLYGLGDSQLLINEHLPVILQSVDALVGDI